MRCAVIKRRGSGRNKTMDDLDSIASCWFECTSVPSAATLGQENVWQQRTETAERNRSRQDVEEMIRDELWNHRLRSSSGVVCGVVRAPGQ